MAPSARQRAEAEYGVTFDFPNLSLHSAAANGNIGLVKYALSNGQPSNAVLNGVLPIHAAASSGYETIVRMLIENGANVNSPRLPRRLSNDKSRGAGLTVGTAGSTPLHFAAANGHIAVIELLLACGAKPDSVEKLGRTPEMLALEHGHPVAAELLRTGAQNFREGALEEATDEDDDGASFVSRKSSKPRSPLSASLTPNRTVGPYRLGPSASSSSLRMAGLASASAMAKPARRLLASQGSSDSLSLRASASALKDRVRSSSPHKRPTPVNMLSTRSERMTRQSSSGDSHSLIAAPGPSRRPSLPSVFDRAAQSLGLSSPSPSTSSRPAPLTISQSSHNHPRMRSGTGSSSRTLASVFTRKTDDATSPSLSYRDGSSAGGSPPLMSDSDVASSSGFPTPRRGMSQEELGDEQRAFLGLPVPPATAPAHQSSFPQGVQGMSHSASTGQIPPVPSYRPRKASQLSSVAITGLTEIRKTSPDGAVAEDEDDGDDAVSLGPGGSMHRRNSSSTSAKAKAFFGRMSRASSRRSSFSEKASRPSFASGDSSENARTAFREETVTPEDRPVPDEAVATLDPHDTASEAGDTFPGPSSRETAVARANSRSRGDSVGSNASSASRFTGPSSYVGNLSPLANAASTDHLHPGDATAVARTRPSRSGSSATDPDLRQVALGNAALASSSANASILSGSPGSNTSSAAPSSAHSAHSTAATSAIWSSTSTHASRGSDMRPAKMRTATSTSTSSGGNPPRTPTGELITPSLAHSLVQKAQQDLLAYDPSNASSSLSEQLAALGEKLSIEREVKAAAERSKHGHATAAPTPYVWEKLGKDGTRTPVQRSERRTATPVGLGLHRGPGHAFQQGSLDRRRPSAPTLRQDYKLANEPVRHDSGSTYRAVGPSATHAEPARLRLDSTDSTPPIATAAQRIYDQRSTALATHTKNASSIMHRTTGSDSGLLAPPSRPEAKRRVSNESRRARSIDRRSPTEPSSADSSAVEAPRVPLVSATLLTPSAPPCQQHRAPRSSPTNHYLSADDKLDLHRTPSKLSTGTLEPPVAPVTVEGARSASGGSNGKVRRFMHALTGRG